MILRTLIAEPDRATADAWRTALEADGHRVTIARSGTEFESAARSPFDLAVVDARALGKEEASLVDFLRGRSPHARIILTYEPADMDLALRLQQRTMAFPVRKPLPASELAAHVRRLAQATAPAMAGLPDEADDRPFEFEGLVGRSLALRRIIRLAAKVAPTDSTVVLTGETGSGKEVIARVIQRRSRRADGPFVTVNCGAIPANLVESELFGHKKGAFTDATTDKKGLLEIAHGGTILLDEIGDLPLQAQVKLLRAIEESEIRRVGDTQPIRTDARVIAATNKDLQKEVEAGRFREDLWFRLNVVQIHLTPLRERMDDIPPLLLHFLRESDARFGKPAVGFSREALGIISRYPFPGNIRELRNLVEHAVVMADQPEIRVEDLPIHVVAAASRDRLLEAPGTARPVAHHAVTTPGPLPAALLPEPDFKTLAEMEKEWITWTLRKLDGNQTEVAKKLGISRSTLWRKIKEYGIEL